MTGAAAHRDTDVQPSRWTELVERVRRSDASAVELLYGIFRNGVRSQVSRQIGPQTLDDVVHDGFVTVFQAVLRGRVREPDRLMGFVRTVMRRRVGAHIQEAVQRRRLESGDLAFLFREQPDPERLAIARQRNDITHRVLLLLSSRDREILVRFYLCGESPPNICAEMKLTKDQFRLLKSRAKARFAKAGKRWMAQRPKFLPGSAPP